MLYRNWIQPIPQKNSIDGDHKLVLTVAYLNKHLHQNHVCWQRNIKLTNMSDSFISVSLSVAIVSVFGNSKHSLVWLTSPKATDLYFLLCCEIYLELTALGLCIMYIHLKAYLEVSIFFCFTFWKVYLCQAVHVSKVSLQSRHIWKWHLEDYVTLHPDSLLFYVFGRCQNSKLQKYLQMYPIGCNRLQAQLKGIPI